MEESQKKRKKKQKQVNGEKWHGRRTMQGAYSDIGVEKDGRCSREVKGVMEIDRDIENDIIPQISEENRYVIATQNHQKQVGGGRESERGYARRCRLG